MELNLKQEAGLREAVTRYQRHEPYTCIAGYAGTGKSTLVTYIIDALDIHREDVAYVAYTGKAAMVLRNKGCPNATTTHKLLYDACPRKDGTFYFKIKRPLDQPYKLIVVDEISMLPKEMWELLLSHHIHVLALGDPAQLPPIGDDNGVLAHPHIFLDEVMRQAQESEILRLSMDVREGKPLKFFKGSEVQVIAPGELIDGMYTWADAILVAKNATRQNLNYYLRRQKFGEDVPNEPVNGDQVICTHNYWTESTEGKDPLVNGTIGTLFNVRNLHNQYRVPDITIANFQPIEYGNEVLVKDHYFEKLKMDHKLLATGEPFINKDNFSKIPKMFHPKTFEFGYALTVWKAQGSEYDRVLLFEENFPFDAELKQRYLYTGITRASERLVIVKGFK